MLSKKIILGGLVLSATACAHNPESNKTPNIIYILADDLGIGDLGCYGQQKILTPNIDKLASQGMMFTDHYAGCTVSAPSRSVLMTGLHTGHTYVRGNRELKTEGQFPMSGNAYTVAEMLKDAGYVTGAFGKWGLGSPGSEGDPNNQGFEEFFGYNCQRHAHRYYPTHIWHNQEKYILEGNDNKNKVSYAPDVIHKRSLEFIKENKDNKFFAYIPIVQPHAELVAPNDEIFAKYDGKFEEKPYVATKPGADYGSDNFDFMQYCSQEKPHATFASMVSRVDKYVGEIMDLLKELELEDNTIVIFSSDNGAHLEGGADPEFFNSNGPFTGHKRDLTEGGIRVPMIAYWKNKIAPGQTSEHISAFWDMMPTFAEIAQVQPPVNDGISILPTLVGNKEEQKEHESMYWEYSAGKGGMAVRIGNWKAIKMGINKNPNAPIKLYDLSNDIAETINVADQHPNIVKKAQQIMEAEHVLNSDYLFKYEKNSIK